MKTLLALALLLPALLFAGENKLDHLSKIVTVNLDGNDIQLVVTHSDDRNVYYRADDFDLYDTFLHISVNYKNKFNIQLLSEGVSHKIENINFINEKVRYHANSQVINKHEHSLEKNYFEYFYMSKLEDDVVKTDFVLSKLFATNYFERIDSKGKYTSEIDYRACDGCEHGDQFFISTKYGQINIVHQDFGTFYTPTCDEELHPWLAQLIELKVPFTYYGTIDASSSDLWEGTQDHWMAAKGLLLIGTKKENQFARFMQLVIFKAAESLGANPLVEYEKIIKNGKFVNYVDGVLNFEYQGVIIKLQID